MIFLGTHRLGASVACAKISFIASASTSMAGLVLLNWCRACRKERRGSGGGGADGDVIYAASS